MIDTKTGYMIGNPIIYELDKSAYVTATTDPETSAETEELNEAEYDADMDVISDFNLENNIEDLDGETLKMAAICAYGARLLYIDTDGQTKVTGIEPWECLFIDEGALGEPVYAMRYYEVTDEGKKKILVEWYDAEFVSYYISEEITLPSGEKKIQYKAYNKNGVESQPHMFTGIPLIQFPNNKELQGDCDKVYALIDGYDFALSDVNSEVEQFRLAYLAFYGSAPSAEVLSEARKTGAFGMPDKDDKIEFITKDLNDTIIENHLDRLEDNIYRFAKSVNFHDEAFSGNVSGIAMKFKMFGLESKCIMTERKFTAALRRQFKLLTTVWATKGIEMDYRDINFVWTRNFPLNLLDEAQTTVALKGTISDKTRLGLLSFVDDPEKELAQMEQESEGMVDLNAPMEEEGAFGDQEGEEGLPGSQPFGAKPGGVANQGRREKAVGAG